MLVSTQSARSICGLRLIKDRYGIGSLGLYPPFFVETHAVASQLEHGVACKNDPVTGT